MIEELRCWPSCVRHWGWIYVPRRIWHLTRPGRRERERVALRRVAAVTRRLVDTPLGTGLSLRQAAGLPSDLRGDIFVGLMSGGISLAPDELDRLISDPAGVRAEYPELFK